MQALGMYCQLCPDDNDAWFTNGGSLQAWVKPGSLTPTVAPTSAPSLAPTSAPSLTPTVVPTTAPTTFDVQCEIAIREGCPTSGEWHAAMVDVVGESVVGVDVQYSGWCASIGEGEVRRLLSTNSVANLTLLTTGVSSTYAIMQQVHAGVVSGSLTTSLGVSGNSVIDTTSTFSSPSFQTQMRTIFPVHDTSLVALYLGSGQPPSAAQVISSLGLTSVEGFLVVSCSSGIPDGNGATTYVIQIEFVVRYVAIEPTQVETPALQAGRIILAVSGLSMPGYGGQFVLTAIPEIILRSSGEAVILPGLLAPTGAKEYDARRDFTDQGLLVRYNADLMSLKSCKDREGTSVVAATTLPDRTEYAFGLSVIFISPLNPTDPTNNEYRSTCRDTNYKVDVNSRMSALTGFTSDYNGDSGQPIEDQVYVATAEYKPCDSIGGRTDACSESIGPENECAPIGSNAAKNMHKRLLYVVYLDLGNKQRTLSDGTTQTVRYSISSVAEIAAFAAPTIGGCGGNCFDAVPTGVRVEDHHDGFSRTIVEFTTGCLSLTPAQSVAPIDNAFATCARCPDDNTNFDFDMQLTECTGSGSETRCSLRGDKRSVTVAMNHVEEPATIQWAIDNQQKVGFQVDFRHEREYDEAGLDGDGIAQNTSIGPSDAAYYYETQEDIDAWRSRSTLGVDPSTGAFHVVRDDVLAISLGFEQGTAAEEVMIGSLQEVHMGQFKAQCHHPAFTGSVLQESTGGIECTRSNMIGPWSTHSPFVFIGSGSPKCINYPKACNFVTNDIGAEFPKLTLSKETWEAFLRAVYDKHSDASHNQGPTGGLNALFEDDELAEAEFMRTTLIYESQHLVGGGVVTNQALGLYGSCEPNRVSGPEITAGGEPLKLFFPGQRSDRSGYGVCTCKGMMAYNFETSSLVTGDVTHPYRTIRQPVYSQNMYDADPTKLANLHKCPQLNYHQSGDGKVLPSWDQFYFDARTLLAGKEYFFHLELELSDPEVFGVSPQTGARRMQSVSTSSLFNLGIDSTGTRVISERNAANHYTSQGVGSIMIVEDTGSSADSGQGDSATSLGQIALFVIFVLAVLFWLYPSLLCGVDACNSQSWSRCTPFLRLAVLWFAVCCIFFASNDVLWSYQLSALLMLLVWCGLSLYYTYLGSNWADRIIGCPADASDNEEDTKETEKRRKKTMMIFAISHFSVLLFIFTCVATNTHLFDLDLDSLSSTLMFGCIYLLIFPTRYFLLWIHCKRDAKNLSNFLEGCDVIVFDGFGVLSCCTKKLENSQTQMHNNHNHDIFKCKVDDMIDDSKGMEVVKTYGIVRRAQFRI
jgi:hypothetical protein